MHYPLAQHAIVASSFLARCQSGPPCRHRSTRRPTSARCPPRMRPPGSRGARTFGAGLCVSTCYDVIAANGHSCSAFHVRGFSQSGRSRSVFQVGSSLGIFVQLFMRGRPCNKNVSFVAIRRGDRPIGYRRVTRSFFLPRRRGGKSSSTCKAARDPSVPQLDTHTQIARYVHLAH